MVAVGYLLILNHWQEDPQYQACLWTMTIPVPREDIICTGQVMDYSNLIYYLNQPILICPVKRTLFLVMAVTLHLYTKLVQARQYSLFLRMGWSVIGILMRGQEIQPKTVAEKEMM